MQEILFNISPLHLTQVLLVDNMASFEQFGHSILTSIQYRFFGIFIKETAMNIYIPFIHKIVKKEKKQKYLPLYIEEENINTKIIENNIDNQKEEKENIIIIELF
jgi:hypothetical protein